MRRADNPYDRNQISPPDFNGKREKVVEMFVAGHGVDYTAATLGLPRTAVRRIRDEELRSNAEERDAMRLQIKMQHAALLRPLMERWQEAGKKADRKDAEVILAILREQRRLFGLDEAVRIEVTEVNQLSDDDLDRELARHGVKQLAPPEPKPLPPPPEFTDAEVVERSAATDQATPHTKPAEAEADDDSSSQTAGS